MREGTPLFGLCVYCGQRTEADTPEALVEVIEAHTLTCDQRPEARLTARIEELERALATQAAKIRALRERLERIASACERASASSALEWQRIACEVRAAPGSVAGMVGEAR